MPLIRCTIKLQKEMGLKQADIVDNEAPLSYLGAWHANLIHIDRKKCVLLVNDKTLLNFLIPDLARVQIRVLDDGFRRLLPDVLASEGMSDDLINTILSEYQSIRYANTSSKSVLGSMNDLAFHYKHHILSEGGLNQCHLPDVIKRLNHMPMGALDYQYAADVLKTLYDVKT